MKYFLAIVSLLALFGASAMLRASAPLIDFDRDDAAAHWQLSPETAGGSRLELTETFATAGNRSLCFTTPRWTDGAPAYPAFSFHGNLGSFQAYDQLAFDLFNPTPYGVQFGMHIGPAGIARDAGPYYELKIRPYQLKRVVLPLAELNARFGAEPIGQFYFYSMRRAFPAEVYFDNFRLLKTGEKPAPYSREVKNRLRKWMTPWKAAVSEEFYPTKVPIHSSALTEPYKQFLIGEFDRTHQECLNALAKVIQNNYDGVDDDAAIIAFQNSRQNMKRVASLLQLKQDNDRLFQDDPDLLLAFSDAMTKYPPRLLPFAAAVGDHHLIRLARNETEAAQLLALPLTRDTRIELQCGTPQRADGMAFPDGALTASVVGFVQTTKLAPFDAPIVGWYPDPILDFMTGCDIAAGDLQSFWLRVRAPEDQAPGRYTAKLEILKDGERWRTLQLEIEVLPFTLPRHSPLPSVISFGTDKLSKDPEKRRRWSHFLDDYLIGMDDLYRRDAPDFEIIERLHRERRLVAFNLGNIPGDALDPATRQIDVGKLLARFRPLYEQSRALGVLNHAYIYGFDEVEAADFDNLETCAAALHEAFPEVAIMTTAWDHTLGTDGRINSVDIWVPKTERYARDRSAVERSRARGNRVWYYICNFPVPPHINWFIEQPAMTARLLMGVMSEKFQPDGFLYYALRIWWDNQPLTDGPYTSWWPESWYNHHGDGLLAYPGPDDQPLAGIRLENYRDGLEDFAYLCILNAQIAATEALPADRSSAEQLQWLKTARETAVIPAQLVRHLADFSCLPAELAAYRNRLIQAIVSSEIQDVDPWGPEFDVRSFHQSRQHQENNHEK